MEKYINENTIVKDTIYDMFSEEIKCQNCNCIMIIPLISLSCQFTFCKNCKEIMKNNCSNVKLLILQKRKRIIYRNLIINVSKAVMKK